MVIPYLTLLPFLLKIAFLPPSASWTTLPDELLKTKFGYQVLSDKTPTIEGGKIKCDTPYMCKTAVVSDSVGSCTICEAEIGIPASPYYGADLDVEVSPYDKLHLPGFEAASESGEETQSSSGSGSGSSSSSSSASLMSSSSTSLMSSISKAVGGKQNEEICPPRIDDDFVLPCCSPLRDLTGALTIKPAPTGASLVEVSRHLRHSRSSSKQGFISSVLPCCGMGPSCCRWCKDICDDLEDSVPSLPRLWWSLCNGADSTEGTQKDEFYNRIANAMYPRKGAVGGGGLSNSPLGQATSIFRL